MTSSTPLRHAVVLGAGLAGLAAAIRLKERGVERVIVLERAERPGGLAISLHFGDLASDLGPHRLYTEIPEVEQFYTDVAGPDMMTVRRQSSMFLHGKFLHYPLGVADMLRGPGPLRLAQFAASWAATQGRDALGQIDKQGFEGVMHGAFGRALYEYLIGPYTAKVWKTDPRTLDAEAARVRVSAGSLTRSVRRLFLHEQKGTQTALKEFHYVKGGAQTLVNRLVERATALGAIILPRHEATGFRLGENGAIEAVEVNSAAEGRYLCPAERVISTVPLPQLVGMLNAASYVVDVAQPPAENIGQPSPAVFAFSPPSPPQAWGNASQCAAALRYLDLIFLFVVVARERIRGDQWIYFPEPQFVFNRASEARAFDPGMGAPGKSILCVEATCRPGQDLAVKSDAEISEQMLAGLLTTGIFQRKEVVETFVHRLPFAYPVYDRDYGQRLQTILREFAARVPNLITTGRQGLFNFNNMDHSIYMGLRAGECSLANENPARKWLEECLEFGKFRIVD